MAGHRGGSLASGALGASHRGPSATFATIEPSKEAHDSEVLVTQCRRARRPRRREPTAVSGHAASTYQACEIALLLSFDELPRDDDIGFLAQAFGVF